MKFRFVGGLDCPDWVLAEIADFTKIEIKSFQFLCGNVLDRLCLNDKTWDFESVQAGQAQFKGSVSALAFILAKSAKHRCDPTDLEKEMLQLGMAGDHALKLSRIYSDNFSKITEILGQKFIREPNLMLVKKDVQEVRGLTVHTLHCRAEKKKVEFVISDPKFHSLKDELLFALQAAENLKK